MTLKAGILFGTLTLLSVPSLGDVLVTKDGERLLGNLLSVRDDTIQWYSPTFGTLYINKYQVDQMVLSEALDINGHREPCIMDDYDQGMVRLNCNGQETYVHLDMIYALEPWISEDYRYFKYSGEVSLYGELLWGNKQDKDWTFDADAQVDIEDIRHRGGLYYKRDDSSEAGTEAEIEMKINYDVDWYYNEYWFVNGNTEWSKDDSEDIKNRYELGVGVGYRFWDEEIDHLWVRTGPAYVRETVIDDPVNVTTNSPGWNYELNWQQELHFGAFHSSPILFHEHRVIATHTDGVRLEVDTITGIRFPLWDALKADFELDIDYDSDPGEEFEHMDYRFLMGLSYTF